MIDIYLDILPSWMFIPTHGALFTVDVLTSFFFKWSKILGYWCTFLCSHLLWSVKFFCWNLFRPVYIFYFQCNQIVITNYFAVTSDLERLWPLGDLEFWMTLNHLKIQLRHNERNDVLRGVISIVLCINTISYFHSVICTC